MSTSLAMPPSTVPTYLRVADDLEVVARSAVPGQRLPSEHELCERHAVSRLTARAALQELERRHLVRRVRGSGTYVARRIDYPVRAGDGAELERDRAPSGRRAASGGARNRAGRAANARTGRSALSARAGVVVTVTRLGHVDGLVSGIATSWLPRRVVGSNNPDEFIDDGESLYAALVARGFRPRRRWTRAELDVVPPEVAPQLELEGRPLVWHTHTLNEDETTRPSGRVRRGMEPARRVPDDLRVRRSTMSPERRCELLAIADRAELIELAESCATSAPAPVVRRAPEIGTILLDVREPIAHDRFHLGEVLACQAEVSVGGAVGWSMRLGDDRLATLAAAMCDATVEAAAPLAGRGSRPVRAHGVAPGRRPGGRVERAGADNRHVRGAVMGGAALSTLASQAAFRDLLAALAHPGRPRRLDVPAGVPAALMVPLALADLTQRVAVVGDEAERWGARLVDATGCLIAGPGDADQVVVLPGAASPALVAEIRRGSAVTPEAGAGCRSGARPSAPMATSSSASAVRASTARRRSA